MQLQLQFLLPKFVVAVEPELVLEPVLVLALVPVSVQLVVGFDFVLIQFHFAVRSIEFVAENDTHHRKKLRKLLCI